jgi:hypothetical protein
VREANPAYVIHGRFVFKSSWRCSGGRIKIRKKPNLDTWGTESITKQGLLHTEINGEIVKKHIPTLQGIIMIILTVFYSITNDIKEPVTATDGYTL